MPETSGPGLGPTLQSSRPGAGSTELPVHQRTVDMQAFEREGHLVVIGTLHDQRPWASEGLAVRHAHRMELGIVVRQADLVIVDAVATMDTFPHAECPTIEDSFTDLIGMSVSRGYNSGVQARFGRTRGCSHLEFLARALGPVVLQAVSSSSARRIEEGRDEGGEMPFEERSKRLVDTCHVWAEGGVAVQKVAAGWLPTKGVYPAPSLVEIRRRNEAGH